MLTIKTSILLKLLVCLLVPVFLVLGAAQVLVTDQYLRFEYGQTDFPADAFGFDKAQRLFYASENFRWVQDGLPIKRLASQQLSDQPLYNQRELRHMQDVQDVFQISRRIWHIALGLLALILIFTLVHDEYLLDLAQAFKIGGLIVSGIFIVVGILAVIAWQIWFVAFHQIFFSPGTWTFNSSDTLIRLFPERFWYDAALTLSSLILISSLGIALFGWVIERESKFIAETGRDRILKPSKS